MHPGKTVPLRDAELKKTSEWSLSHLLLIDTLTVEKPDAPPNVKKKKNKEKAKNGEMPSWMLKFAQDNKLNVLSDVKFDEPPKEASHSGSDEES